jgi:hypothetical protein
VVLTPPREAASLMPASNRSASSPPSGPPSYDAKGGARKQYRCERGVL